jgi:ribonucleoside-diphosphate reductase beta chain
LNDWNNKLNDDERHFIKHILAFFAASCMVSEREFIENFVTRQYAEAKFLLWFSRIMMKTPVISTIN